VDNKNTYCIGLIRINGEKVKTNCKIGGLEVNPANFEFKERQAFLIEIVAEKACEPSFNSKGRSIQREVSITISLFKLFTTNKLA
jgi:hypothetical protein